MSFFPLRVSLTWHGNCLAYLNINIPTHQTHRHNPLAPTLYTKSHILYLFQMNLNRFPHRDPACCNTTDPGWRRSSRALSSPAGPPALNTSTFCSTYRKNVTRKSPHLKLVLGDTKWCSAMLNLSPVGAAPSEDIILATSSSRNPPWQSRMQRGWDQGIAS